ncbi:hypothetical protein HDV01_007294 [Terramyces sp. JEL0728]|nr:hypothetical protein HDV01_007294 [Terramyces sp. JEL0728]
MDPTEITDPILQQDLKTYQQLKLQSQIQKSLDLSRLSSVKTAIKEMALLEIQPLLDLEYYRKKELLISLMDIYHRLQFIDLNVEYNIDLIDQTNTINKENKQLDGGSYLGMKKYLDKVLVGLQQLPSNYKERILQINRLYEEFQLMAADCPNNLDMKNTDVLPIPQERLAVKEGAVQIQQGHQAETDDTTHVQQEKEEIPIHQDILPIPQIESIGYQDYAYLKLDKPILKQSNIEKSIAIK